MDYRPKQGKFRKTQTQTQLERESLRKLERALERKEFGA